MEFVLFVTLLFGAAWLIAAPLRRPRDDARAAAGGEAAVIEAARDAKLREIGEAALDLRMGKLSRADHEQVDRALRREALELLHELDACRDSRRGRR